MNNSFSSGTKLSERPQSKRKEIIKAKIRGNSSERKIKTSASSTPNSETSKNQRSADLSKRINRNESESNVSQSSQTPEPEYQDLWITEKAELTDTLNQIKKLNNSLMTENEKLQMKLKHKEDIEKLVMDQLYEFKGKYEELAASNLQKDQELKALKEALNQKHSELETAQKQISFLQTKTLGESAIHTRFDASSIDIQKSKTLFSSNQSTNISSQAINPVTNSQKRINQRGQQELIMPFLSGAANRWMTSLRSEEVSPQNEERSISPQRRKLNSKVVEVVREKFLAKIKPKTENNTVA